MDGLDSLGIDDEIGFDPGAFLQAAGGVAQYGISAAETEKKEKEGKANQSKALASAIAADYAAAEAMTKAAVSAQLKSPSAEIDATAAQMAVQAQDRVFTDPALSLSPESAKKRVESAEKALAASLKEAQTKPKDGYAQAKVSAWQAIVNKAQSGAISAGAGQSGLANYGGESWFTRPVAGKLSGGAVLGIGAAALVVVGLVVKKVFFTAAA